MPRLTKEISEIIILPEKWKSTWNPTDGNGNPIFAELPEYEIGPGSVRVFSLSQEKREKIQQKCLKITITDGKAIPVLDTTLAQEELFVARLGGSRGQWTEFYGPAPDGQTLNCTEENQRHFSYNEGLRVFVCHHVGPILDKIAEGKADEEEKNSLLSLTGKPASGNGSTQKDASGAKKR